MNKDKKLNEAIPEDREPELVTVSVGDETFEYNPESPDVDDIIITSGGGVFVLIEDEDGEDLIYRYNASSVEEIVYQNTGYEMSEAAEDQEEGDSDE